MKQIMSLVALLLSSQVLMSVDIEVKPSLNHVVTAAVQSAADSLGRCGGGCLKFGPGTYTIGSVRLWSNTRVELDSCAVILGSCDPYDYVGYAPDGIHPGDMKALFYADSASNISITGNGIIDGRGLDLVLAIDSLHHTGLRIDSNYNYRRMRPSIRPNLLRFNHVDSLTISRVRLRSSAGWGVSIHNSTCVMVNGVDFVNRAYWNNDGIDIVDSRRVVIRDCDINSADDGIVLKSFDPSGGCDSVSVIDCTIRSSASAFKIGTETYGMFTNIAVSGLKVRDTYRSAIAVESVDGARIDNVVVDGVDAENTGNALFIRLGHRNGLAPGSISNVTVRNLTCTVPFGRPDEAYDLRGPGLNTIFNPIPASITGLPDARVTNVTLENVTVTYPGRATKGMGYVGKYRVSSMPDNRDSYPEFTMFGELPAWGLFIRHVDGITLDNVNLRVENPDYRDAIVTDDVIDLKAIGGLF